jgi:SET and MYND domain-containing protein
VCANCFAYEAGRSLKFRHGKTNFSFCTTSCIDQWTIETPQLAIEAWSTIESFIKKRSSRSGLAISNQSIPNNGNDVVDDRWNKPSTVEIDKEWRSVEDTAQFIRQARKGSKAKAHVRALQSVLSIMPQSEALYFLLSGVMVHESLITNSCSKEYHAWQYIQTLTEDPTPYNSNFHLKEYVYGYLQLLALVPVSMLPSVTVSACRQIVARDSHNSFGIRSLEDDGSEFFGWGVWPEASFFNHSCQPNVAKRRVGRTWQFWAARDLECGEELLISYLGGDENDLNQTERRHRLRSWGFDCSCSRCLAETDESCVERLTSTSSETCLNKKMRRLALK